MTAPRTLLKAWQLRPRKNLGQNFLVDAGIAGNIVEAAQITAQATVLEIGAGLGALTVPAATCARKVIAVEKDRRLAELLRTELAVCKLGNVEIVSKDIFDCDLETMAPGAAPGLTVLGNLPYNISSQVVVKLIDQRLHIRRAVLMFQKEVAERLAAGPGTKRYGRLSVLLQYCADIETVCLVPAKAFYPRPKVDSMVIKIKFRKPDRETDLKTMGKLVRAAFGRRRKTLRNSLAGGLRELDTVGAEQLLAKAGIDSRRRAETLSVAEFVRLTDCFRTSFPESFP